MSKKQEKLNKEFIRCATLGYLGTMQNALNAGASINAVDEDGWTALMLAVNYTSELIIEFLIKKGIDLTLKDDDGYTALDMAKEDGIEEIIKLLEDKMSKETKKEKGADYFKKKCSKLAKAISTCSVKALDSALTNVTGLVKDITKRLDEKKK